jgi:hypothetical protein
VWYAVSKDEGRTWDEQGQALGLGEPRTFDSFGVFTPNILAYEGKYWLYYTGVRPTPGRAGVFENNSTNDPTAIGVAVADHPGGPFVKQNDGRPVQNSGHEVQVFVHDGAVMSLVSPTGPLGCSLQCAEDGLSFRTLLRGLLNQPKAPGLYRPELTDSARDLPLPTWGIAMGTYGGDPYLVRYESIWNAP